MQNSAFVRYNLALAACIVAFLTVGGLGLWVLDRLERLPAPPLTATNCIDEKFKFLHDSPIRDPNLIAVGSSVTWRNLDFSVLERGEPGPARVINAAPCYLYVHETAYLTRFYLDNMPSVKAVLSIFAMRDFEACRGPEAFFDPDEARRYVFRKAPAWHLYFKNFRPHRFGSDVVRIQKMRASTDGGLLMDSYGSGPLTIFPPELRGDMRATRECLDHLARLGAEMQHRGVKWVVALLPPMPAWIEAYDPGGERDRAWRDAVADALRGTGTVILDGRHGPPVQDLDFTDPAHFHWNSVPKFTRWVIDGMRREAVITPLLQETAGAL